MVDSKGLLISLRKILNETKQDPRCRELYRRSGGGLLPFVGSLDPVFLFLGLNPAGVTLYEVPSSADEYLEFAKSYFSSDSTDRGSFLRYLPYTANMSGDYATFGEVAMASFLVPISTRKSSEVSDKEAQACWPRYLTLLSVLSPKLIVVHGSMVWNLLSGVKPFSQPQLVDLPPTHRRPLKELYATLEAEVLPFCSKVEGLSEQPAVWWLPVPHLGKAPPGKETRRKCELAAEIARRRMHGRGGTRVRVRRRA